MKSPHQWRKAFQVGPFQVWERKVKAQVMAECVLVSPETYFVTRIGDPAPKDSCLGWAISGGLLERLCRAVAYGPGDQSRIDKCCFCGRTARKGEFATYDRERVICPSCDYMLARLEEVRDRGGEQR